MTAARGPGSASTGREIVTVAAATLLAALVAFVCAPLGMTAVYGLIGLLILGIGVHLLREELLPPLAAAWRRARPGNHARRRPARRIGRRHVALAVVPVVGMAFVGGGKGLLALAAVVAALLFGAVTVVLWPAVSAIVRRLPQDVPARPARVVTPSGGRLLTSPVLGTAIVLVGVTGAAFVLAGMGLKGVIALIGLIGIVGTLVITRNRSVVMTFLATASLGFILHKSFSVQSLDHSGGAISVYVTSVDALIVVLYGLWVHEGTFVQDVRDGLRQRFVLLPLVGVVFLLFSLLAAPSPLLGFAELTRMGWMYLLFFYAAVRIRTREHVVAVLAGLGVFAAFEFVIIVLQWRTGGVLGLAFLGVPTTLTQRTTDVSSIGRPFGTIIHPVFMGAAMGSLALVSLSLAITLQRSLAKIVAAGMVAACSIPLYLSHTRASAIAAVIAGTYIVAVGIRRGWLTWNTVGRFALAALVGVAAFLPALSARFSENFGTGHFWEEIDSRLQLNEIGYKMMNDHWVFGAGLNNFETVMPHYESHFTIFANNPVHNLYLLMLSETGIVGFVGFSVVALGMLRCAWRATRTDDRLLSGVAIGVVAMMGFLGLEELLGFSLRQDVPLAIYWLLAGLALACGRISGAGTQERDTWELIRPRAADPRGEPAMARAVRPPRAVRPARAGLALVATALLTAGGLATATPATATTAPATATTPAPPVPGILFSGTDRVSGDRAIWAAAGDGSDVRQLTPSDGLYYSWPRFAFDNTKIVYTVRRITSAATSIAIMNTDGTHRQTIASFDFYVGQPLVDASGRYLYFTGVAPWYYHTGVFKLDLRTLQSTNLSGVSTRLVGTDSDPILTPDKASLITIHGFRGHSTVDQLSFDGTRRTTLLDDQWFNTDPVLSPSARSLAVSSYRAPGPPKKISRNFRLVQRNLSTGASQLFTQGLACSTRPTSNPCTVPQMSAYQPRYTNDGTRLAFHGALDNATTCICTVRVNGTAPSVLVSSTRIAIAWFSLRPPAGGSTAGIATIGAAAPRTRVLYVQKPAGGGAARLVSASPDLMHRTVIGLPRGLYPLDARWGPKRSIVFTATVPLPKATKNNPGPSGPHALPRSVARKQVFVRTADGAVRQLTSVRTARSYRGDVVANDFGTFARDGRSVFVTSTSTTTGESWIVRVDVRTRHAVNLSRAHLPAGTPSVETLPAVSPNGRTVAFVRTSASGSEIWTMDARTGRSVRQVTHTHGRDSSPVWTRDGSAIVHVTNVGHTPTLAKTSVRTGRTVYLPTGTHRTVAFPTIDPSGAGVLFVGSTRTTLDVFATRIDGRGTAAARQPDPIHNALFLDWK